MSRPEKVQPKDYPVWKKLIDEIPRKEKEPKKEYVKRLNGHAALRGLEKISDKIFTPLEISTTYEEFLRLKNDRKEENAVQQSMWDEKPMINGVFVRLMARHEELEKSVADLKNDIMLCIDLYENDRWKGKVV